MDSRTPAEVERGVALIKAHMPETYKAIQARATEIGNDVFKGVRAGLRGEPNRFWAMEGGHVVGTPFNQRDITDELAGQMVRWGSAYVCIFGQATEGAANGTH